jgi:drug/metabolite transporter (DMT)-like permease
MKHWKAILIFSIGASSFGVTPIFSKLGFAAGFSLGEIIWKQMLIASVILWSITLFKKTNWKGITKKSILALMLSGTLAGLTNVLYYASMLYLPASIAVILVFQFVWIGVLYEVIFSRKLPSKTTLLSVILTLIGVFLASNAVEGGFSNVPIIAIILGIGSAFCFAGFIYSSGRVAKDVDPFLRSSFMVSGSLVLMTVLFPPTSISIETLTSSVWFYSLGVAIFGSILPPLLFAISAPHLPNSLCSILGAIELPMTIIMAKLVLSESVSLLQWVGIIIIMICMSINEIKAMITKLFNKKLNDKTNQSIT